MYKDRGEKENYRQCNLNFVKDRTKNQSFLKCLSPWPKVTTVYGKI